MKLFLTLFATCALALGFTVSASAQRPIGAGSLVLDDGNGHKITLLCPPTLTCSPTYYLPALGCGTQTIGVVPNGTAEGQILYWNNTLGAWQTLNVGGSGAFLSSNGSDPVWGSALANPMTTAGDIIYENSTPAPARLAGAITNGSVLTYNTVTPAPQWTATLPIANGGTNSGTTLTNGKMMISSSNAIVEGPTWTSGTSTLTGNITGNAVTATTATTGNNVATSSVSSNSSYYPLFTNSSATSASQAVDVTGGISLNPSTNTITATTFSGNATSATTATTGNNVATSSVSSNTSYYPLFTNSSATSLSQAVDVTGGISLNPSTNTITATTFSGALSGNATTATTGNNVATSSVSSNTSYYPLFTNSSATSLSQAVDVTGGISLNPSTNTITATTFSGALSGNATTATTGNNVATSSVSSNTSYYPLFTNSSATSASQAVDVTGGISLNPSTNTITATTFSGNATSATLATTATTSNNVATSSVSSNSSYYPLFTNSSATSASQAVDVTGGISLNPSTNTITATTFSGNATSATTAATGNNVATASVSSNTSYYPLFTNSSATSASQAVDVTGGISLNPSTNTITATTFSGNATSATTATTGNNVATASVSSNTSYYPLFTNSSATSLSQAVDVTGGISLNPSTNTITATTFSGNATTATTGTNVATTGTGTNASYYPTFVSSSSSSASTALDVDAGISYNPSSNTLTLGVPATAGGTGNLALANATGSNYTTIEAGASAPTMTYILPTSAPAVNDVLQANGATSPVQLSWAPQSGGGGSSTVTVVGTSQPLFNNTLTDATDLSLSAAASNNYEFEGVLYVSSASATPDFKFEIASSNNATIYCWYMTRSTSDAGSGAGLLSVASGTATNVSSPTTAGVNTTISVGAGDPTEVFIHGIIINGAAASTVNVKWAQTTTNATATTLEAGSYIHFTNY